MSISMMVCHDILCGDINVDSAIAIARFYGLDNLVYDQGWTATAPPNYPYPENLEHGRAVINLWLYNKYTQDK